MSRRRSARLQGKASPGPQPTVNFDERLDFLRLDAGDDDDVDLPLRRRFEHRIEGASGPVEVVYWPARAARKQVPEQVTSFILGNPGLIDYYLPFLSHLHSVLPDGHAILCTSHVGHEPHLPAPSKPAELSTLLETKIELTSAIRVSLDAWAGQSATRPKLVLMGHSLGGWLTCEIMKRLNTDDDPTAIHAGHLLFPSLGWMAQTWNGRTMWPLFSPLVINTLPTVSYLLRPILPMTTFPATTLALLRSPTTIYHTLQLARSELAGIQAPDLEWTESQTKGPPTSGLYGVWSAGSLDGWVGKDGPMVQERLGGIPGSRVRVLDKVAHAFCLSEEHSRRVAEIVAGWMTGRSETHPEQHVHSSERALSSVAPM